MERGEGEEGEVGGGGVCCFLRLLGDWGSRDMDKVGLEGSRLGTLGVGRRFLVIWY